MKLKIHFTKNNLMKITSVIDADVHNQLIETFRARGKGYFFAPSFKNWLAIQKLKKQIAERKQNGKNTENLKKTLQACYTKHSWDGYTNFYYPDSKNLQIGFFREFFQILKNNNVEYQVTNDESTENFFKQKPKLNPLPHLTFYEWQEKATNLLLKKKRGLVLSPTGTGKTAVMASVANSLKGKTLILFNRVILTNQTKEKFQEYGMEKPIIVLHNKSKDAITNDKNDITLMTVQSFAKIKNHNIFDHIIVDEVHHAKSKTYVKIIKKCVNAWFRIGFTATLPVEKTEKMTMIGNIADVVYEGNLNEHIGVRLSKPNFKFIDYFQGFQQKSFNTDINSKFHVFKEDEPFYESVSINLKNNTKTLILFQQKDKGKQFAKKHNKEFIDVTKKKDKDEVISNFYSDDSNLLVGSYKAFGKNVEIPDSITVLILKPLQLYHELEEKYITFNEQRNTAIVKVVKEFLKEDKKVLVLTHRQDHGKILSEKLNAEYIYGETDNKKREEAIQKFSTGVNKIFIGSAGCFGEGIDIQGGCDALVLTNSNTSSLPVIQQVGRALRKNENMEVTVVDFYDCAHKVFEDHSKARFKIIKKYYDTVPEIVKL